MKSAEKARTHGLSSLSFGGFGLISGVLKRSRKFGRCKKQTMWTFGAPKLLTKVLSLSTPAIPESSRSDYENIEKTKGIHQPEKVVPNARHAQPPPVGMQKLSPRTQIGFFYVPSLSLEQDSRSYIENE